jgi:hypothetical protein
MFFFNYLMKVFPLRRNLKSRLTALSSALQENNLQERLTLG